MNNDEAWVLSKIIASMALVLGFFVYWSLATEQLEDLMSDYNQSESRSPASLVKISDLKGGHLLTKATMSTIDLNCVNQGDEIKIKSQTHQLRIVGRICEDASKEASKSEQHHQIYISNTSNGFDATVFERPDRKFTTDYVYLNKGINRIAISTLPPGSDTTELLKEVIIEKMDRLVLNEDSSEITDSK